MIYLTEVFEQLQSAELSLKMYTGDDGLIQTKYYNRLLSVINIGCTVLYRRFELKNNSLVLRTTTNKVSYRLESANALSKNIDGYIIDSEDAPFTDDIMQIKSIFDLDGNELILNNYREGLSSKLDSVGTPYELGLSFYTPEQLVVRTPIKMLPSDLLVTYRCSFKPLKLFPIGELDFDIEHTIIELPMPYLNALVYYIAARLSNASGAETIGRGIFHEGNNYKKMFEEECASLALSGIEVDVMVSDNDGVRQKGFV